jgi:exodeoxyribonuclease VII small subunit
MKESEPLSAQLARLEEIVRLLESEDGDLDRALALFEEGVSRLRSARDQLADAELKVQKVLGEVRGELRVEDVRE